ncbi:B-cell lymphoma/leukemia 11A-like isoform X2 [Portunus trituberculatus]|uniref:B-cell lymphoma/leukemia 11A-like isoform X2 n=1 Tax=Portunus trituberculatus TaxID=210409 RepID=UPI001E1D18C1|nr:B-cell lymphoma/leukemia 11A-like isoform X2 [Portunus trituberculatus]
MMGTQVIAALLRLTGDGAGECADVLTCGVCQKDFLLADILRFIQHKVHNCQAPSAPCGQDAASGEQDVPASAPPSATRDHNGDVGSEGPSNPASPATVTGDGDDNKADEKRKRDDEDDAPARKKPRSTQDAEANTTDTEPARYVCGTCGAVLGSAWSLVQHVQSSHGIIIYQEAPGGIPLSAPSTPPGLPRPSHSSPLASVSSTATTASGPHPPPLQLLDPSKVDLTKVDITKVDLSKVDLSKIAAPVTSGATPLPPHPPVTAPLLDPSHPFNLLRMPIGDTRAPFPPGLTPPFVRPGHDFRMDQLLQEGLRLNPGLLPPHFERPPFLDPGLGAPRHAAPTPLNTGGDPNLDFYSQRLRQLAGTTSPTSSTSPRKPLPTPPFTSPNGPTPSSQAPSQTPTSTRTDSTSTASKLRRFKCMTCYKSFRWESNLAIHQRIHTGEKDYRCPKCQETLSSPQTLRIHMKSHRKSSSTESNSPDSSRPQTEDDNDEEEEEEEEEEDDEEEPDDDEENPSICDSVDEDEDIVEEEIEDDEPEDLSTTSKSTPAPPTQSVSSSTAENHKMPLGDQQRTVVGELIDKFGLGNISAYSEAYQQALKESGRLSHHYIGKDGEKNHTNGIEKLKLRDDLTKGMMGSQPTLDLAHQTLLGAFDNPYDAQKRIAAAQRDGGLYAGLWFPNLAGTGAPPKDIFSGMQTSDANFLHRKLMPEGPMKPGDVPVALPKPGTSSAPGTPISLVPPTKKESRRNDTCEFCGKVFKNCSNLTVHRRSHTGEKPYKCDLCSYACAQSSKLTRHMKTHGRMGKDVYRCRFCDMPFSVASTLEKHMRKCVVNQNKKGLFPPLSAGGHEGLDSYKGLHFTPVISDDSSKSSSLFSPHFNTTPTAATTPNDDTGDSSNLSGPGS